MFRKPKNKQKILKFPKYGDIPRRSYTFTLGEIYIVSAYRDSRCQFIKVTPKGFNLLILEQSKCLLKTHLYDRTYTGMDIPRKETTFKVMIPNWIWKITKEAVESKSA